MPVSSISCCQQLKPPAPTKEGSTTHLPLLRRACVTAAAACVVIGATGVMANGDGAAIARETATRAGAPYDAVLLHVQAPGAARWSDRRQCPPWRANTLENIVPENLPRPSARRRFNGVTAVERAPAPGPSASPEAVIPFLALRSGMGCFSL